MPTPLPEARSPRDDLAACRRLLANGSRSFDLAARGLAREVRDDATVLYAFCRLADDAVDASREPARALAALEQRLDDLYAARPQANPVDRAMADLVARHRLPRALPAALLEGLAWDVAGHEYATLEALCAYAARVAGSVGAMMAIIMGQRDRDTLACACELGVAMQLTNIARDVGEDAAMGRCYLPRQWRMQETGDARRAEIADCSPGARARLVRRLLQHAERHYRFALPGIAALPRRCRFGVRAAAAIYADIGRVIASNGYDSTTQRAVVPANRKIVLLAASVRRPRDCQPESAVTSAPAGDQIAFLVDAAATAPAAGTAGAIRPSELRWWQLPSQWAWVLELFARLETRKRLDRGRPRTSNEISAIDASSQR